MIFFFFFFFKQKTAYEMSIGDWSSDVCSSDLSGRFKPAPSAASRPRPSSSTACCMRPASRSEERRVGKEFNRRVDLGGRRIIKKKKKKKKMKKKYKKYKKKLKKIIKIT